MCGSMVDIQSATAQIRRGKKKNKLQFKNIMSASATQGSHNYRPRALFNLCVMMPYLIIYFPRYASWKCSLIGIGQIQ